MAILAKAWHIPKLGRTYADLGLIRDRDSSAGYLYMKKCPEGTKKIHHAMDKEFRAPIEIRRIYHAVLEVDVELFVPENPVLAVIFCALVCPDHVSDELAMIDTIAQSPQVLENVLSPLVEVVLLVVERTLNVDGRECAD